MENTIINPMWIYYASVLNIVSKASIVVAVICGASAFWEFVNYKTKWEKDEWYKDELRDYKCRIKFFTTTFIITAMLAIFIPNKTTLLEMFVASKLTPETIQQVGGTAETVASKAVDIVADAVIKVMNSAK